MTEGYTPIEQTFYPYECNECGAVVDQYGVRKHDDWHAGLKDA